MTTNNETNNVYSITDFKRTSTMHPFFFIKYTCKTSSKLNPCLRRNNLDSSLFYSILILISNVLFLNKVRNHIFTHIFHKHPERLSSKMLTPRGYSPNVRRSRVIAGCSQRGVSSKMSNHLSHTNINSHKQIHLKFIIYSSATHHRRHTRHACSQTRCELRAGFVDSFKMF